MWVDQAEDPRTAGSPQGELATVREYLTNYRLTLGMKCDGLDAGQLATRSVPPSTMSLLGLVRHMAQVENSWFERCLRGSTDGPRPFAREDDRDWDFNGATGDPEVVEEAFATWRAEIAKADEWLDSIADGRPRPRGAAPRRHGVGARRARAHGRGVRPALWPRRPAARVHRRTDRPVTSGIPSQRTPFVLTTPASQGAENEDALATGPGIGVVVDGAGLPEDLRRGCQHSVSWFARRIADSFRDRLALRSSTMQQALADAITEVAALHRPTCDLAQGSPSATVAAWRVDDASVEYLALCDASVIVVGTDGTARELTDDRVEQVTRPLIDARLEAKQDAGGAVSFTDVREARREAVETTRNTRDGFWCVQDDPRAAYRAVHGSLDRGEVEGIVVATDGATRAFHLLATHTVDEFAQTALDGGLVAVAQAVRGAERAQTSTLTADGLKVHDDLTVVADRL